MFGFGFGFGFGLMVRVRIASLYASDDLGPYTP